MTDLECDILAVKLNSEYDFELAKFRSHNIWPREAIAEGLWAARTENENELNANRLRAWRSRQRYIEEPPKRGMFTDCVFYVDPEGHLG